MDEMILKLIEAIKKKYKAKSTQDKIFKELLKAPGSREYVTAYETAKAAGYELEDALVESWNQLMDGNEVYASTMRQVLEGIVPSMDENVWAACEQIQNNMNKAAGLGIKAQTAELNPSELRNIAESMDGKKVELIDGKLATYACKVVDMTQSSNMDLAMDLGFEIQVTRKYDGVGLHRRTKHAEKCVWCTEKAGTHRFKNSEEVQKAGVFARHDGCGCTIDYENVRTGTRTANVQNYRGGRR
ncbi:MAG: hypothetical protein K6F63_03925 [Lachnospiraceae bacterium]|nr:hypothetical protein [Lachnospiraceae bacterium]